MVNADMGAPSVSAGRAKCLRVPQKAAQFPARIESTKSSPVTVGGAGMSKAKRTPPGRRWSPTEKIKTSVNPSQNWGMEIPTRATNVPSLSSHEYLRTAESTPAGIPMIRDTTIAARVSSMVAGSLSRISSFTDTRARREVPQSPRRIPATKLKYCSIKGRSRPSSARISSISS